MGKYDKSDAELKHGKANYQVNKLAQLQDINLYLFIIYYEVCICAILVIYFQYDLNKYVKILITILFLIYPFVIRSIEMAELKGTEFNESLFYGVPTKEKIE